MGALNLKALGFGTPRILGDVLPKVVYFSQFPTSGNPPIDVNSDNRPASSDAEIITRQSTSAITSDDPITPTAV